MKNKMKILKLKTISAISLLIPLSQNAIAAGFEAPLYSASALGTSYAGATTGSHDISNSFENPANVIGIKNKEFIISTSYLDINIDSDNANGTNNNQDYNAGVNKLIPALYYAMPINKNLAFGLNITSPYGLATEYSNNWAGNADAIKSEIITNNFNPYLSRKINEKLSLGFGIQAQYIEATLTKNANGNSALFAKVKGNDWDYGFNLGAKYKLNNNTNLGAGYRSKIDHKIKGTGEIKGLSISDKISTQLITPESLSLGISHQLNNKIQLLSDIRWMRWSRIQKIDIMSENATLAGDDLNFKFKDSFRYSIGANLKNSDKLLSRIGLAYEEGANSSVEYRSPRIPTGDRTWLSYGLNYKLNKNTNLDFSYVHQIYTKTRTSTDSLEAEYKTNVNVLSAAINYKF